MPKKSAAEVSDYELQRQENIAKNQALLRQLQLEAASAGIAPKKASRPAADKSAKRKRTPVQKVKEEVQPRRTSSRLKGIVADSEVARRKAEEESELLAQAERAKRQRVSADLRFSDVVVAGKDWDQSGNFLRIVGPANPGERTFSAQDVKETTDKELKELRERMSNLELWEGFEPSQIKITPERIYSLGFHPTTDKALVFAGDKLGSLGLFDASQQPTPAIKNEDDDESDNEEEAKPSITTLKIHTRTISAFQFSPHDPNALYSASYDSSIRKLDLQKGVAVEAYAPLSKDDDEPLSGVEMSQFDPHTLFFSTLNGNFGRHDTRAKPGSGTDIFALSEKKIGGFSLNPAHPHIFATASLDRYLRLWDLRMLKGSGDDKAPVEIGAHESRLSVSHAAFNSAGQLATASYDDTVKIYDFSSVGTLSSGTELNDEQMTPTTIIPHNNQTGRWVTMYVFTLLLSLPFPPPPFSPSPLSPFFFQVYAILTPKNSLRAQWQLQPADNIQRFVIGNMNRFVDVYASNGQQLAQLGGEGITAVPSVAQFHQSKDWIAAGTASGKLCLWM
jgi:WD40 repeat protein